ncbi:IS200/IS605 family transposase (plasmid) [Borreliella californiensis]|uniref:Putative transposase n=1 Tax=Borreliella californiensis TaxID=373543 RepID=A0A7W9ZNP8_9SPIR|nr:putative transposase [Borreliella californiensis]MBB6213663.1 putative transposase [Borreliella californiensis]
MSQKLNFNNHCIYSINYHLILVTKYRHKCINAKLSSSLCQIIINICYLWKVTLNEFNHDKDHIHLLLEFTPNIQPSKFINNLKTVSSRLIRKKYSTYLDKYYWKPYFWSRSYCLISTGGASIDFIKKYIQNQNKSIY